MSHTPRILSIETLFKGWGSYLRAQVVFPDGTVAPREIEHHGSAACVLPYDPDRRVAMLVRQLRAPMLLEQAHDGMMLEAPAGLLDGEDPEICARREAEEEVGLTLRDVERVGPSNPMPGISSETIHLFLAAYSAADRSGTGGGLADENEQLVVIEMKLSELAAMADAGTLPDMKTFALIQTLRLRRPALFGDGRR